MKHFILLLCFTGLWLLPFCQNILQAEYFIDTDAGYGRNTIVNVSPAADLTIPFTINLSGFAPGYHKLYVRTRDDHGSWSLTQKSNIEVFATPEKIMVVAGEYFIDTDPGFGNGMPVTITNPDSMVLLHFEAATAALPVGYHKLYGRFEDSKGRWGLGFRSNMEVYANSSPNVFQAEYFFNTDRGFGNCASVVLTNAAGDGTFTFSVPASEIIAGADTFFVRVQENITGKWSITQANSIEAALPLTLLSFNVIKQNNTAQISWQTDHEVNTAVFAVERSGDGRQFSAIGQTAAAGNSTHAINYNYTDNNLASITSATIYYRLKMIDRGGKFTYSEIKSIDHTTVTGMRIYPNPVVRDQLSVQVSPIDGIAELVIYNATGMQVYAKEFTAVAGHLQAKVNISQCSAGNYFIKITGKSFTNTQKFIKIK